MSNETNLIPLNNRSKEERRRIASEGGKASAAAKKKKKMLSEYLDVAINSPITNTKILNYTLENFNFKEDDLNYNACIVGGLIEAAVKGNVEAIKLIREMTNDKPLAEDIKTKIAIPAELIGKAFTEINYDINKRKHLDYWMKRRKRFDKIKLCRTKSY